MQLQLVAGGLGLGGEVNGGFECGGFDEGRFGVYGEPDGGVGDGEVEGGEGLIGYFDGGCVDHSRVFDEFGDAWEEEDVVEEVGEFGLEDADAEWEGGGGGFVVFPGGGEVGVGVGAVGNERHAAGAGLVDAEEVGGLVVGGDALADGLGGIGVAEFVFVEEGDGVGLDGGVGGGDGVQKLSGVHGVNYGREFGGGW